MALGVAWDRVGNVFIVCHGKDAPTPEEWTEVMDEMQGPIADLSGVLVFSAGAGISATQRQDIQSLLADTDVKVAVLTESRLARGAVTALSWFNVPIRAYPHAKTAEAIESLEPHDVKAVTARLRQLRSRVV